MRFLFLAFLAAVEASQIIVGERCPVGYRRDAIGICRQAFDDEELPSHSISRRQCECVPYYMCRLEDVMNSGSNCGESEVCCKKGASTEEYCGWGISSSASDTEPGEFPWVVAILNVTTNETWTREEFIGGGSIVHPRYVLTAAHKVKGKKENTIKCRAGQLMRLAPEPKVTQDRLVARIIIHRSYDRQYLANDIALIELKEPFEVSQPMVRPACVGMGFTGPPSGSKCFATGWGRRRYNSSDQEADKLKKVQLPMVPREVCWRALQAVDDERRRQRGQEPIRRRELHSSLFCAGGLEGQDTCVGDGGSPLVCQIQANSTHARWAVFGLVAWGVGCGASGAPGVYVDVAWNRIFVRTFGGMGVVPPAVINSLIGK